MGELDELMWEAWVRVRERVMGDEGELRRRLARREKTYEHVPRALCMAIRASDRRITEVSAWIGPRWALAPGEECEHEVRITSELMRELCRPVEACWLTEFADVSKKLGSYVGRCKELEGLGIVNGRRIARLGGKPGKPVPQITSGVSAMEGRKSPKWREVLLLDACARRNAPPHELLVPFWREMGVRLPDGIEQVVARRPVFRVQNGRRYMRGWTWVCPGCGSEAKTIYFPMGAPNWAAIRGIKLPEGWYEEPRQSGCLACYHCHRLMRFPRSDRKAVRVSWNNLIGHMSGGLLYGSEVERPASFGIEAKGKRFTVRRASPRRDELERYLGESDMEVSEVARRMGMKRRSAVRALQAICKLRGVKGREGLRTWWARRRMAEGPGVAAA